MIHLSVFSSLFLAPLQPDPGAPVKYVKLKITHMGLFGVSQKVLRQVCYTFNRRHSFDRSYHQIFVKKHVWSDFVWFLFFVAFPKRNFGLDSSQSRWLWLGAKNSTNREFSGENNCDESWDLDEEYVEKQFGYFQRYHLFVLQLFDTPFYMTNVTNPLICFNGRTYYY